MITKINAYSQKRPVLGSDVKTFTDPAQPGQVLELDLHGIDGAEQLVAREFADEMLVMYNGDPVNDIPPSRPRPVLDGKPIAISRITAQNCAYVEAMQNGTSPEERYSFEQLLGFTVTMPTAFWSAVAWAGTLNRAPAKNDSAADTEAS